MQDNDLKLKQEVIEYVDQCFKTAIIGAVYAIEKEFKDSPQFQAVRKKILDNGNDQKRNVLRLLNKIGISQSQFSYEFEFTR